jgi:hypothetical protein
MLSFTFEPSALFRGRVPMSIIIFWAPRLASLAVGLSAHSPRSAGREQPSRGQELPPVALPLLPLLLLIGFLPCGLSATIPGAE